MADFKPAPPIGPPPRDVPPVIPPRTQTDTFQTKRPKRGEPLVASKIDPEPLSLEAIYETPSILLEKTPSDKSIPPLFGSLRTTPASNTRRRSSLSNTSKESQQNNPVHTVPPSKSDLLFSGGQPFVPNISSGDSAFTSIEMKMNTSALTISHPDCQKIDNSDNICSTCGLGGDLVCCDGEKCTRVFHPYCANPPIVQLQNSNDEKWYCRACRPIFQRHEAQFAVEPFKSIIQALHKVNPIHFYIPETVLQSFPADLRAQVVTSVSSKPSRKRNGPTSTNFVCFRCVRSCRLDDSARCSQCNTAFHYNCVTPPLTHVGDSQPWICPLHPPTPFNRRFRLANRGLRDFEEWMFTKEAPLNFIKKVKKERTLLQKATAEEAQTFLDYLLSGHTREAVTNAIMTAPKLVASKARLPASELLSQRRGSYTSVKSVSDIDRKTVSTLMPVGKALMARTDVMTKPELISCIDALRLIVLRQAGLGAGEVLEILPHQELYMNHPKTSTEDVNLLADLIHLREATPPPKTPLIPALRIPSTGETVFLKSDKDAIRVGYCTSCDINLSEHMIIDTPIDCNEYFLLEIGENQKSCIAKTNGENSLILRRRGHVDQVDTTGTELTEGDVLRCGNYDVVFTLAVSYENANSSLANVEK
eukprot:gene3071-5848_t